mgnify:CR=1 FL=1
MLLGRVMLSPDYDIVATTQIYPRRAYECGEAGAAEIYIDDLWQNQATRYGIHEDYFDWTNSSPWEVAAAYAEKTFVTIHSRNLNNLDFSGMKCEDLPRHAYGRDIDSNTIFSPED